jgi:hypothetical protein
MKSVQTMRAGQRVKIAIRRQLHNSLEEKAGSEFFVANVGS